jgi:copper(I)-binding protein
MTPVQRSARLGGLLVTLLVVAVLATACSSGGGASIKVTDPWARASAATAAAGAAYMSIQNTGSAADALLGASSPAASTVEVHQTVVLGSPTPSASGDAGMGSPMPGASVGTGGMMGMQPVARLEIPAGGTVELKPGSYHIMITGLTQPLKAGSTVEVTLTFEKAAPITVKAEVRAA